MKTIMKDALYQTARITRVKAYVPYSGFAVGAALRTESGAIFSGCNVENASFGLTTCAERNAIAAMVADAEYKISKLIVVTDTPEPATPCGACRQVIAEFATPKTRVVCANLNGDCREFTMEELLPAQFEKKTLKQGHKSR